MSFLTTLETDAEKVGGFIVKEITAAENLLGAKTGNAKLNLVVSAVSAGLTAIGINVSGAESEITNAINALVALLNKGGVLAAPAAPPKA